MPNDKDARTDADREVAAVPMVTDEQIERLWMESFPRNEDCLALTCAVALHGKDGTGNHQVWVDSGSFLPIGQQDRQRILSMSRAEARAKCAEAIAARAASMASEEA